MDHLLLRSLARHDGLASRRQLLQDGVSQRMLDLAWRSGRLVRVRHGVYATPGLARPLVRAARVGGALAGPSATTLLGGWCPPGDVLFVSARRNDHRLRDPDDAGRLLDQHSPHVSVIRDLHRLDAATERLCASPVTAASQCVRHLPEWEAIAVLDSLRRAGHLLDPVDVELVRRALPSRLRPVIDLVDARAGSGTESIMRVRLRAAGIATLVQPQVTADIRPDLLIGDRLIVECVSVEHHSSPEEYNKDRRRIARLVVLGYTVLEFPYPEICFNWPAVLETVESAMWTLGIAKGEQPRIRTLR